MSEQVLAQSPTANETIRLRLSHQLTDSEATILLGYQGIHGGFDETGFTGYDYPNQQWIRMEAANDA